MRFVAEDLDREVLELPVGFKYIASKMMQREVLVGGEESGGIGFGNHLPERDALFAALLLLEALIAAGQKLGEKIDSLQSRFGTTFYERIDLTLPDVSTRKQIEALLRVNTPTLVAGYPVKESITIDGIKLRIGACHWLMFRFSGTEPLLRIYCEAPTKENAVKTLEWAKDFAAKI